MCEQYILEAKCHAIRDAQVLEHDQVRKEMQVEERRLDEMMEAERQNALRVQEEIERRRREESYLRALQILDQIKENEKERSVLVSVANYICHYYSIYCTFYILKSYV